MTGRPQRKLVMHSKLNRPAGDEGKSPGLEAAPDLSPAHHTRYRCAERVGGVGMSLA